MAKDVRETPQPCDLVAFAAHPDDAELGCGGTLALCAEQGWKTAVVDFTRGEQGTRGTPEERAREAADASKVLGLSCRINLGLPDGHLRDSDENRRRVVQLLREMRPRLVLAPPRNDHHPDHMAVAEILERSFYLAGIGKYPGAEANSPPWKPHALLHWMGSRAAIPSLVVDISSVVERRTRAIRCHASQLHQHDSAAPSTRISHPGFLDWIDGGLRRLGFLIGATHGEGFTGSGPVPVLDIVQQFGRTPWQEPEHES